MESPSQAPYLHSTNMKSKRMVVLGAIVALHLIIIYAFVVGLAQTGVRYVQTILHTSIIDQAKQHDLPPPPKNVKLNQAAPVQVVAPQVAINIPAPPPPIHIVRPKAPPPPPPRPAPIVVTQQSQAVFPNTEDYYPAIAQRLGQEGSAIVDFCTDAAGRITRVSLAHSSGVPRLDQAALQLTRAARNVKAARTNTGHPIKSCRDVLVKFQLSAAQ